MVPPQLSGVSENHAHERTLLALIFLNDDEERPSGFSVLHLMFNRFLVGS